MSSEKLNICDPTGNYDYIGVTLMKIIYEELCSAVLVKIDGGQWAEEREMLRSGACRFLKEWAWRFSISSFGTDFIQIAF